GDTRRWIAVQGSNLGATLALPGIANIQIDNVSVSVNRASGGYTNPTTHVTILARPIDWTTAIGTGNATTHAFTPTAVTVTIAGGTLTITLAGDVLSVSGDITSLTIGSFISGSAHFELQKTTVSVDLNGDGTTDLTGAT